MNHLENVYITAHSPRKIEPLELESYGLRPCHLGVLPNSGSELLESSRRDMYLLYRSPGWQQLMTSTGNR